MAKKKTLAEIKTGYRQGKVTYSQLMANVLADNSRKVAAAVANISDDHYKKAVSKKTGKVTLPRVEELIPRKSMVLNKTVQDGRLITNTLKEALITDLRTSLEENRSTLASGKNAGRVNPKLVDAFKEKITETFSNYVEDNPRLDMPANIHTIAVGEVRSMVNQTKDNYTKEFVKQNPQYTMMKRWLHNPKLSKKPRPHHAEAEQEYADGIPVNENFVLSTGVSLRYPHDPKAPIEEVAGCNCDVEYFLFEKDEEEYAQTGMWFLDSVSKAAKPIGALSKRSDGLYRKVSETKWEKVDPKEYSNAAASHLGDVYHKQTKFLSLPNLLANDSVQVVLNKLGVDPTKIKDRKEVLGHIQSFLNNMKGGTTAAPTNTPTPPKSAPIESAPPPAPKAPKTPKEAAHEYFEKELDNSTLYKAIANVGSPQAVELQKHMLTVFGPKTDMYRVAQKLYESVGSSSSVYAIIQRTKTAVDKVNADPERYKNPKNGADGAVATQAWAAQNATAAQIMALRNYTVTAYSYLNKQMRENTTELDKQDLEKIAHISKFLHDAPKVDVTTWRGMNPYDSDKKRIIAALDNAKDSGAHIQMRSFTSTSAVPDVAESFGGNSGITFEIKGKTGVALSNSLTSRAGLQEREILFDRGATFRVVASHDTGVSRKYTLEEIDLHKI